MKKLTIVTSYNTGAPLYRVASIINTLREFEIHLVAPIRPEDFLSIPALSNKNITIHNIGDFQSRQRNFIIRFFQEFIFSMKCSAKARKIKSDYEIITIPFTSLIITSQLIKSKAPRIVDVRDLVWEYIDAKSFFQRILKMVLKKSHLFFLKKYDCITLTNHKEQSTLQQDINKRIEVASNGISEYSYRQIRSKVSKLARTESETIKITYIGNVGLLQNLGVFIDVISQFSNMEFIIVGDGNDFENLQAKLKTEQIRNVKLIGKVKEDMLYEYHNQTHFLFASLNPNIVSAVPSKLYEYLSTGIPIIYSGRGMAAELLSQFENVSICDYTPESLRLVLESIQNNKADTNPSGNFKILEEKYIREKINDKFIQIIDSL